MRSPEYAQIINWVSSIWDSFDPIIIQSTFDQAGFTSNLIEDFHRQLRHFLLNQEFSDDIEVDDYQNINGFFSGDEFTIEDLDILFIYLLNRVRTACRSKIKFK